MDAITDAPRDGGRRAEFRPGPLGLQGANGLPGANGPRPGRAGRDLTQGPITRTLLVFSLPLLGGNALQSLNGTVNQFWVSHTLGDVAIAALGNANIIMML